VRNYGYTVSSRVSIYYVAISYVILRFISEVVGGIYILIMLILVLSGSINLVCIPYSLD
jgi:hypothetical protein